MARPNGAAEMNIADRQTPHGRAAAALEEGRPIEAQYVRQGRRGGRVMVMLTVSALLAVAALFGVWVVEAPKRPATAPAAAAPARPATPTGAS
jgi:hypothetical protein